MLPRWGKGADKAKLTKLTKLTKRAAKAATDGDAAAVARIERDIDGIVYRLFDLTAAGSPTRRTP